MTSSFRIKKKFEDQARWSFGPYWNHYVRPYGNCHPDYTSIPIGRPEGVQICVRRDISTLQKYPPDRQKPLDPKDPNDVIFNPMLYEGTKARNAIQMFNPWEYDKRRSPYESFNRSNDTWRKEIITDGTGIMANYSYTPEERYNSSVNGNKPSTPLSLYPRNEVYSEQVTYGAPCGPFKTYRAEVNPNEYRFRTAKRK